MLNVRYSYLHENSQKYPVLEVNRPAPLSIWGCALRPLRTFVTKWGHAFFPHHCGGMYVYVYAKTPQDLHDKILAGLRLTIIVLPGKKQHNMSIDHLSGQISSRPKTKDRFGPEKVVNREK